MLPSPQLAFPMQMIPFLSFPEKFLIPIPHPSSRSRGQNTHTQERGKELPKYFHQSKSLGLHHAHLHKNPTGPRIGVTITPLLLLLLFLRLGMFFQQALLLMGGKLLLLCVTWEKECEGPSYTE